MTIDLVFSPELRLSDGTVIKDRNAAIQFCATIACVYQMQEASRFCICWRTRRRRKNSKVRLRDFGVGSPILIVTGNGAERKGRISRDHVGGGDPNKRRMQLAGRERGRREGEGKGGGKERGVGGGDIGGRGRGGGGGRGGGEEGGEGGGGGREGGGEGEGERREGGGGGGERRGRECAGREEGGRDYPGFFLSVARRERCRLSRMTSANSSWKPVSTPSM